MRGQGQNKLYDMRETSEHGHPHFSVKSQEAAPRCDRRCPSIPDDKEDHTNHLIGYAGDIDDTIII